MSKDEIRVKLAEVKSKNLEIIHESKCITCGRDAPKSCLEFGHLVKAKKSSGQSSRPCRRRTLKSLENTSVLTAIRSHCMFVFLYNRKTINGLPMNMMEERVAKFVGKDA